MRKIVVGLINYLFFCGIPRKDYNEIKAIVWARNRRVLKITSLLSAAFSLILLIVDIFTKTDTLAPYIMLLVGSITIYLIVMTLGKRFKNAYFSFAVCYGQMTLTIIYAVLLATQASNAAIPATSVIIFIVLLPIAIDDRPIRMYGFMISECIGYLICSSFYKEPNAFKLDCINCITFTLIGLIIYSVVCYRNLTRYSN